MNKIIFKCQFGSHLYGTSVPSSDLDYKSIFIPNSKDMILQRAAKHIQQNTKNNNDIRNSADDIDNEMFSVSQYIKFLCEGQTGALDMLFCTDDLILQNSSIFQDIKANKSKFLHKGTSAFVGYTKQQGAKYGLKGFRVAAIRETLDWLQIFMPYVTVEEAITHNNHPLPKNENINYHVEIIHPKLGPQMHMEVCNRKVPHKATVKYATEVYQRIFDKYGERALKAERNEGIDWKALMHAVRVAREAEELLLTGNITFPRPERELLLKIRKGEMQYKEVETIIEEGLIKIEAAQLKSTLPSKPDLDFAEQFIYSIYKDELFNYLMNKGC